MEEWISFKVSYTRIGMNPDQIERAFQHFTKVDESTRRYGGTGLGLGIANKSSQIMRDILPLRARWEKDQFLL